MSTRTCVNKSITSMKYVWSIQYFIEYMVKWSKETDDQFIHKGNKNSKLSFETLASPSGNERN